MHKQISNKMYEFSLLDETAELSNINSNIELSTMIHSLYELLNRRLVYICVLLNNIGGISYTQLDFFCSYYPPKIEIVLLIKNEIYSRT